MKKIIFIMGQHRSGSSLLSGLFKIFGSYIGRVETPDIDEYNAKGYFENDRIERLNEKMLKFIGNGWNDIKEITESDFSKLLNSEYPNELENILKDDLSLNDNPLLVIKDPRISLLLPIYFKVLKTIPDIDYNFIITQRPYEEITLSLKRAQRLDEGRALNLIKKYEESSKTYIGDNKHLWISVFDCVNYKPIKFMKYLNDYFKINLNINETTTKKAHEFIDISLRNFSVKRNCKVISTYHGPKRFSDTKGIIEIITMHINKEKQLDSGCFNDVIIVNHKNDFNFPYKDEFYKILEDIDGTPTRNGVFKVIHRPFQNGVGGSYASFNYVFEKFKDDYEYWFFTEDNVIIMEKNIFKECIDQLNIDTSVKFIGCMRIKTALSHIKNNKYPEHNHGGCGCVHVDSLLEVYNKFKKLPYSNHPMTESMIKKITNPSYKDGEDIILRDGEWSKWYRSFELEGEVMFTNVYVQLGYKLGILKYENPISHWLHIKNKQIIREHKG